jgi:superfamily I DNA/RNA helicase
MTFHSSKGLDFKNVFIPNLNSDTTLIARQALEKDPDIDRRLLFVAVTRSRENLFLSFNSKKPHPYVANLPKAVITEVDARKKSNSSKEDFF